jgi:MFS family permease
MGVIGTIGYMLYGVGSIPAGILTDKYGAKRMLTAGVIGMGVTSILVGISPVGWFFAITYALLGLAASIYHPSGLPLIAKHIEKKGKALGFHGIMGNLGITAGPLFAAFMIMVFNTWRAAYIVFGIIGLGFAFYLQRVTVENEADFSFADVIKWDRKRKAAKAEAAAQANADNATGESGDLFTGANSDNDKTVTIPVSLIMIYIGCVIFGFIYRGAITYFPTLYLQEIEFISSQLPPKPTVLAGHLTGVVLSAGMIGLWLAGYISDRIKRPEAAQIIVFAAIAPLLYIISNTSEVPVLIYSAVFSLVFFGWQPLQNTLIANYTSKRSHGIGYGINFFLIMGVGSLATAAGGYLTDEHGAYAVYSMLAIVALVGMVAAVGVLKFNKYSIKFSYSLLKETQDEC